MTWLLDANVLVALCLDSHVHHRRVHEWFPALKRDRFATCPFTQGTLLRLHMRSAQVTDAWLAELARRRRGRLATLDSGLAAQHPDVAEVLPL